MSIDSTPGPNDDTPARRDHVPPWALVVIVIVAVIVAYSILQTAIGGGGTLG